MKKLIFLFIFLLQLNANNIEGLIYNYFNAIENKSLSQIKTLLYHPSDKRLILYKAVFEGVDQDIKSFSILNQDIINNKAIIKVNLKAKIQDNFSNKNFDEDVNLIFLLQKDGNNWKIAKVMSDTDFDIVKKSLFLQQINPIKYFDGFKYSYEGCYRDQGSPYTYKDRDLHAFGYNSDNLTIETCIKECGRRGYKYAALQYSRSCICDNNYGKYGKANNCNMKCSGDNSEVCGGAWANSIYQIYNPKKSIISQKGIEIGIDRTGGDYKSFNLPYPDYRLCQKACEKDRKCKSWTYVKPYTIQGPMARCWLKNQIPQPNKNSACISGIKNNIIMAEPWFKGWKIISVPLENNKPGKIPNSNQRFGWKYPVKDIGDAMPPKGAYNKALYLHPTSPTKPAILRKNLFITQKNSQMRIRIAGNRNGDFILRVKINGKVIFTQSVDGKKWHNYNISLLDYINQNVNIEIDIVASGWYYEYAYIDEIKFTQ